MVVSMKVCFERGLGAKVTGLKKKKEEVTLGQIL